MQGREGVPLRLLLLLLLLAWAGLGRCRGRGRSRLGLWIDRTQVENLIDLPMKISIINNGLVNRYLKEPGLSGLSEEILIPPQVDTVNLTWQAGHDKFLYSFDNFTSLDPNLLYPPLLGIPTRGLIPSGPTVFQITIPCKGKEEGVASLVLGLTIYNRFNQPLPGTPINFKLRKRCVVFATTSLCLGECENGGTCSDFGQCQCRQGFHGKHCEIALCDPVCQNNGTCISPENCACPSGYHGKLCEIAAACGRPCENGGHCVPEGFCWCQKGFYGDVCEFSQCNPHCTNGGTCIGPDKCECPSNFSGPRCETKEERPRRSKLTNTEQQLKKERTRERRLRTRKQKLERKLEKAERRLLKIMFKNGKSWTLSREERRILRRLQREQTKTGLLQRNDRKYLVKVMTRERKHLIKKHKKTLRRYKKLLKKMRKLNKPRKRKKKKKRVFV
ncbi:wnt inhibitory factor 1-like [Littorina saxatilis]|uniref:wnt inhibitory factor 1-like n=1 Tax=Littorina saxatilis TaxID=31220 RepID=UPI0038B579DE